MGNIAGIDTIGLNETTIQKIENKKDILQFIPVQLIELSKVKHVFHNGTKIKTAYVLDLIHTLITKYHYKDKNSFNLHSGVLKKKYSKEYKAQMDYMIKEGFITLIKNHSKGKSARIYSLNIKFIQQKNKRYVNSDKVIVKKWREKKLSNTLIESNLIDSDVKSKLISDLFSVEIQLDKVIWFLDHLKDNNYNIYNKNQNSSEAIEDGSIFHEFDRFGRMHTNFTTLKSVLRKNCILIDGGEPTEFDIKNSQPLFLTKLIIDSGSKWVDQDELSFFKGLTMNGTYYDFLEEKYDLKDRKEAKDLTYKVLFSVNKLTNKPDKIFRKYFPTIYKFIQLYKKEHKDYRALAHELQRQESNFIFNKLVKHIMLVHPDIKIITVHDSIIVNNKHRGVIQPIFNRMLSEEFNF